jgi:hypothetical protein
MTAPRLPDQRLGGFGGDIGDMLTGFVTRLSQLKQERQADATTQARQALLERQVETQERAGTRLEGQAAETVRANQVQEQLARDRLERQQAQAAAQQASTRARIATIENELGTALQDVEEGMSDDDLLEVRQRQLAALQGLQKEHRTAARAKTGDSAANRERTRQMKFARQRAENMLRGERSSTEVMAQLRKLQANQLSALDEVDLSTAVNDAMNEISSRQGQGLAVLQALGIKGGMGDEPNAPPEIAPPLADPREAERNTALTQRATSARDTELERVQNQLTAKVAERWEEIVDGFLAQGFESEAAGAMATAQIRQEIQQGQFTQAPTPQAESGEAVSSTSLATPEMQQFLQALAGQQPTSTASDIRDALGFGQTKP